MPILESRGHCVCREKSDTTQQTSDEAYRFTRAKTNTGIDPMAAPAPVPPAATQAVLDCWERLGGETCGGRSGLRRHVGVNDIKMVR